MVYLALVETVKRWFYRARPPARVRRPVRERRTHRRAARWSHAGALRRMHTS